MATIVIWQNPSDSGDRIIWNNDNPSAEYYRFELNTGHVINLTRRDSPFNDMHVAISGGGYNSTVQLLNNGEVRAIGDLKLRAGSNNDTSKTLKVVAPDGTTRVNVTNSATTVYDTITISNAAETSWLQLKQGATSDIFELWAKFGLASTKLLTVNVQTGLVTHETTSHFQGGMVVPGRIGPPTTPPSPNINGTMVYDVSNHRLYVWMGAWRSVQLT